MNYDTPQEKTTEAGHINEAFKKVQEYEQLKKEFEELEEDKAGGRDFDKNRYFILKGTIEEMESSEAGEPSLENMWYTVLRNVREIPVSGKGDRTKDVMKILPGGESGLIEEFKPDYDNDSRIGIRMITSVEAIRRLEDSEVVLSKQIEELNKQIEVTKKAKEELQNS